MLSLFQYPEETTKGLFQNNTENGYSEEITKNSQVNTCCWLDNSILWIIHAEQVHTLSRKHFTERELKGTNS